MCLRKGMGMTLDVLIRHMSKAGRDLWDRGWAEANGGNLSLRLTEAQAQGVAMFPPKTDWLPIGVRVPTLRGERFAMTGTGRYLRNIEIAPERNIGFIEVDAVGEAYRILWGFEPNGRPTSELAAHLLSHAAIKAATADVAHAVVHTHAPNLIALTYLLADLGSAALSTLLWRMHAECVVVFPQGVECLPWMMAGSADLGEATASALSRRTLAVWEHHGIVGTGRNLDEAIGRIYVAEKAAGIYLACKAAGGVRKSLSDDQVRAIAANFHCDWDASLLIPGLP